MVFFGPIVLLCLLPAFVAGIENITLTFDSDIVDGVTTMRCDNGTRFVLKADIATKMYLKNGKYINQHECEAVGKTGELQLSSFTKSTDDYYSATVLGISDGKFNCTFFTNRNITNIQPLYYVRGNSYTRIVCLFEIVLKHWESFNAYINGAKLDASESTSGGIDVQFTYHFVPNELIYVKFGKPQVYGTLQFVYSHASGHNYTNKKETVDSVEFQAVLKPEDDKSYVDCMFISNGVETIIRIHMVLKTDKVEHIIRVNGLAVRPADNYYEYKYSGALPNVTCDKNPASSIPFHTNGTRRAVCSIEGQDTQIFLYKNTPCTGIYVSGLSDEKITFETCHDAKHMRVLHYMYTDDEMIEFVCSNGENGPKLNWLMDDIFDAKDEKSEASNIFKRIMKKEYHLSQISCSHDVLQTSITFQYATSPDPPLVEEPADTSETPDDHNKGSTRSKGEGSSIDEQRRPRNNNEGGDPGATFMERYSTHVAGGILAFILLLLCVTLVIVFRRRSKHPKCPPSNIDYANLQNGESAQMPRQQNIYAQPTRQMDDYAVPVDIQDDMNAYSVPYNPKLEDLYAKPLPKNQRTKEELLYAKIGHNEDNNYAQVMPKGKRLANECVYSEVHPSVSDYQAKAKSKDKSEYENEFNTGYVNSNRKEYAEPAYCEVGALTNK